MPQEIIITGVDGKRRRARPHEVLAEGERASFSPMNMLDAMANALTANLNDSYGASVGHKPGYLFDQHQQARDAATQSYVERCRTPGRRMAPPRSTRTAASTIVEAACGNAAELTTTDAAQAWDAKVQRLQNAWRQRG